MEKNERLLEELFSSYDKEMALSPASLIAKSESTDGLSKVIREIFSLARNDSSYGRLQIMLIKHVFKCLTYYTIKGEEVQIDDNPMYKTVLEFHPRLRNIMEQIVKDKVITAGKIVYNIKKDESASEVDKYIFDKYVEYGYFRRALRNEIGTQNKRDDIICLIGMYNQYSKNEENVKKVNTTANLEFKRRLKQFKEDGQKTKEWDEMLHDFCKIKSTGVLWLNSILDFMNSITVQEFLSSKTYQSIIERIKEDINDDNKRVYIEEFYKKYVIKLAKEDIEIDAKQDSIVKELKPSQKEKAIGYNALFMTPESNSDSTGKLSKINYVIEELLEKAYNNSAKLTPEDKEALEQYFNNYYKQTLSEIDLSSSGKLIKLLISIKSFGLHTDEDTKFVKDFYSKNLYSSLRGLLRIDLIRKGIVEKKDIETMNLLTTFSTAEADVLDDFLKATNQNYKSIVVKQYIETFISRRLRKKEENQANYEFILKYIDSITSDNDFSIFKERHFSDLYQLLNNHKFPEEYEKRFKEIVEKNLEVSKIDVKEEKTFVYDFIDKYEGKRITSQEELDDFIKHVGKIKLAEGRIINKKILDFIIRQTLVEDSLISKYTPKYFGFIRSTLEDYGSFDLSSKIPKDSYCYLTRNSITKDNVLGLHIKGRVLITDQAIREFMLNKDISVLDTLFHENTHALQTYDIANKNYYNNYHRYAMAKENIIRRYNGDFYNLNYSTMFIEIEAREKAAEKVSRLITTLLPDMADKIVLNTIKADIINEIDKKLKEERSNYEKGKRKVVSAKDKESHSVSDIFAAIIKSNPVILNKHPEFLREFNKDGSQKTFEEFLRGFDERVSNHDERLLYIHILQSSNYLMDENALETVENFEYTNPRMKGMLLLIKNDIIKYREKNKENTTKSNIPNPASASKEDQGESER